MGCSSSNTLKNNSENNIENPQKENQNENNEETNSLKNLLKKPNLYTSFNFNKSLLSNSNLLLYTTYLNTGNEFLSIVENSKEKTEKLSFKSSNHSIAIGYKKGYKLEFVNQDKFFVLLNGAIDAYCIIDGHGPFGNKVAQTCQDILFEYLLNLDQNSFESDYEKSLNEIFEKINRKIINREEKTYGNYDPFLSGVAVTLLIRIKTMIFCANVGNVLATIFHTDKLMPSKFNITELTFNDSNFSEDLLNNNNMVLNNNNNKMDVKDNETEVESLINPNEINLEIRRIYEHGGEMRKLLGETKSRIFVKGKYFPGLINTRSLGDQIGKGIGILSLPHITTYKLNKGISYYLLMCSDGINNVFPIIKLVNIIQENEQLLLEIVKNIMADSKAMYRAHSYTPDMTIIIKEIKIEDNLI
jgi:serine/threonine protein phosphatase PrpC